MKRWFNVWAALITGVPLAALVAYGEFNSTREGNWLAFSLTATLCVVVVGVPQGCLAAVTALHRRWWRKAVLLAAMVLVGLVSTVGAVVIAVRLSVISPVGRWDPLPAPPGKVTTLVAPICAGRVPALPGLDDPDSATAYVVVDTGQIFKLDGWADPYEAAVLGPYRWTGVDTLPARDCPQPVSADPMPPVPGAEMTRVAVSRSSVDCYEKLQVALSVDGSLWRSARGSCAGPGVGRLIACLFLSPLLSLVAWVSAVVGSRKSRAKSV